MGEFAIQCVACLAGFVWGAGFATRVWLRRLRSGRVRMSDGTVYLVQKIDGARP